MTARIYTNCCWNNIDF